VPTFWRNVLSPCAKEVRLFETLIVIYQNFSQHTPEDYNLNLYRCENHILTNLSSLERNEMYFILKIFRESISHVSEKGVRYYFCCALSSQLH
jgi:hypothetical protein